MDHFKCVVFNHQTYTENINETNYNNKEYKDDNDKPSNDTSESTDVGDLNEPLEKETYTVMNSHVP